MSRWQPASGIFFGNLGLLQEKKLSMVKPRMFGYLSKSWILLIGFLMSSLAAQAQGPKGVPIPVTPPPAKRAPTARKDRSAFPPVPTFKDIAKEVGLTASHVAAPEAHYVIDSTSGGVGLFDCD